MAEWTEKCLTCEKAGHIPKWGWSWACEDDECNYQPYIMGETTAASDDE